MVERLIDELPWPYNMILAIIHETGARRGEVLNLKVGDVEDVGDYTRLRIRKSKYSARFTKLWYSSKAFPRLIIPRKQQCFQ